VGKHGGSESTPTRGVLNGESEADRMSAPGRLPPPYCHDSTSRHLIVNVRRRYGDDRVETRGVATVSTVLLPAFPAADEKQARRMALLQASFSVADVKGFRSSC